MLNDAGGDLDAIADWIGLSGLSIGPDAGLAGRVRSLRAAVAIPYLSETDWSKPHIAGAASFLRASTLQILGDGGNGACHLTQGGTESGFLALFAAREAYVHVADPEILIPWSSHPLYEKAGRMLGVRVRRIAETPDHRVDMAAMEEAITPRTIALAGSLPAWPFGIIDPLPEIGALAEKHGLWFHVDGSIGGLLFPFLDSIPSFARAPLRIPGIRSITADHHKYGYAPTGLSSVSFKNAADAAPLSFKWTGWPGVAYGTESLSGTRSSAPMMAGAAIFRFLGHDGLKALAQEHVALSRRIADAVSAHPGWRVEGKPDGGTLGLVAGEAGVAAALKSLSAEGRQLRHTLQPYGIHTYANAVNPADAGFPEQIGRVLREVIAA